MSWLQDFFREAFGVTDKLGLPAFTMLMMVAVVSIVIATFSRKPILTFSFGVFSVILLLSVPVLNHFFPPAWPVPVQEDENGPAPPVSPTLDARWFDTGLQADWGGKDRFYGGGEYPSYEEDGIVLCNDDLIGRVATCWSSRRADTSTMASDVRTNIAPNVTPPRSDWCAYKDHTVTLAIRPDGIASPGRVYVCARYVERQR